MYTTVISSFGKLVHTQRCDSKAWPVYDTYCIIPNANLEKKRLISVACLLSLSSKAICYGDQRCKYSWAYVQTEETNGYIHENWIVKQHADFQTWLWVCTQIITAKRRGSDMSRVNKAWLLGSSERQQKVLLVQPSHEYKDLKTIFSIIFILLKCYTNTLLELLDDFMGVRIGCLFHILFYILMCQLCTFWFNTFSLPTRQLRPLGQCPSGSCQWRPVNSAH